MKLPKVILDLDGVVAQFYEPLIEEYNKRHDGNLTIGHLDGKLERLGTKTFHQLVEIFNEPGWFIELKPYDNAFDMINALMDRDYKIDICTAPARDNSKFINGQSAAEKFVWVREHFPLLADNIIIARHKANVSGDIIIDDTPHQISSWCEEHPDGVGYLIDRPWNASWQVAEMPFNSVRGPLSGILNFLEDYWCKERGRFGFTAADLRGWSDVKKL